jgi:isopenicillin N synthase-like dioxygenase
MSHVPVIDIREFKAREASSPFVTTLGAAFRDSGFVSLIGHGIDAGLTEPLYKAMARLFALPAEVKGRYSAPGLAGARGYTAFGVEKAKDQSVPDLKEFWHVGRPEDRACPNLWPAEGPEFEAASVALFRALEALGKCVLSAIALHLGLEANYFESRVERGSSILRPLHYPPLPAGTQGVRSAAHEDINLITLLVGSGEPGLEVLHRNGRYLPIEARPGRVVVNVGDMLQRLTNHALVSTTHRVVNPQGEAAQRARYSVPFFLHFNPDVQICTLPGCIDADHPNRYPEPISADAYLHQRLREIGLL